MPGVGGGNDGLAGPGGDASAAGGTNKHWTEADGGRVNVRSVGGEHTRANRGDNGKSRRVANSAAANASNHE